MSFMEIWLSLVKDIQTGSEGKIKYEEILDEEKRGKKRRKSHLNHNFLDFSAICKNETNLFLIAIP